MGKTAKSSLVEVAMARMIPPEFPEDASSPAERILFEAFRDKVSDSWSVVHSLAWLDEEPNSLVEGECDFLCFHPSMGLLAVEAKTGVREYRGSEQAWFQETEGKLKKLKKDPVRQAQESVRALVKKLDQAFGGPGAFPLPFGHAVGFPDSSGVKGGIPPHAPPDLWITAGDLKALEARLESIVARYARGPAKPLTEKQEKLAWGVILPSFRLVRSLGVLVRKQEEGLLRLTNEQWERLRDLEENRRMIVKGVAGSGKTVLAVEMADSLARQGARAALLCYNNGLAEHLKNRAKLRGSGVAISSFHSLCIERAKAAGLRFEVAKEGEAARKFWDETAAELLAEALRAEPGDFDAVVVDEAQDFLGPWWEPVKALLRDPESGYFYLFLDPHQNLFDRPGALPFEGPVKRLRFNCRNTRRITERLHGLIGEKIDEAPFLVEGEPVEETECGSDEEELALVERMVGELTGTGGLSPEQITIMNPHKREHSCFEGCGAVAGFPLAKTIFEPVRGHVRYATIGGFKGLESDCVILCGVREGDDKAENKDLYVACSRAKHVLKIVRRR